MKRILFVAVIGAALLLASCTPDNLPETQTPVAEGGIGGQGGGVPPPPPPPPPGG